MIQSMSETRRIALLGILSSIGVALMYLEIPITLFNFLRIDLSDVVVLVVFATFGFKEAVLVAFVKSFVHFLFPGSNPTYGIGEVAAFLASVSYITGYYIAKSRLKLSKLYASIFSITFMSVLLTFLNWIIIAPLYYIVLYSNSYPDLFNMVYIDSIVSVFLPFNLIKGVVIFSVFYAVEKSLKQYFQESNLA